MTDSERLLTALASLFVLGVAAQWVAAKLRIPSILLLLSTGFVAGPLTGWLVPDKLLGALLFPVVSLSVGLILFEGGLSLRFAELRQIGWALAGLLTIGLAVTWTLTTIGAVYLLQFPWRMALLLGATLVVTGPTVIGPMLRFIRPTGMVGPIARWEGIVIDPIGATLGVLVFETLLHHADPTLEQSTEDALGRLLETLLAGSVCGSLAALGLLFAMRRFWVPDRLRSAVTLAVVIATFTAANLWRDEAGLLAVTLMGVLLANQRTVSIQRIVEFKEDLSVLLISFLFVLLAARLDLKNVAALGWRGMAFLAFLILVVRPLAVLLSTLGTRLNWRERLFLGWFAPRGIVAAAVASVFAIRLDDPQGKLVPATFIVIVGTVVVYGLTAFPLARRLGLAVRNPQGLLIASAHPGARAIAVAVQAAGYRVLLVDSDRGNGNAARLEGLEAVNADLLDEHLVEELDLGGIGRFLAMTSNDEINALSAARFREQFGSAEIYQVAPADSGQTLPDPDSFLVNGRILFGLGLTYAALDERFGAGASVKRTRLTPDFDYDKFIAMHGEQTVVLFVEDAAGRLTVATADARLRPAPGQTLISLVSRPTAEPVVPSPS